MHTDGQKCSPKCESQNIENAPEEALFSAKLFTFDIFSVQNKAIITLLVKKSVWFGLNWNEQQLLEPNVLINCVLRQRI